MNDTWKWELKCSQCKKKIEADDYWIRYSKKLPTGNTRMLLCEDCDDELKTDLLVDGWKKLFSSTSANRETPQNQDTPSDSD